MTMALWQKMLLGIVLISAAGTFTELLLLEHTEEFYQLIPVVLLGLVVVMSVLAFLMPRRGVMAAFRILMLACLISGGLGVLLHYQGNTEFALERHPKMSGFDLFKEAMMGATPALAPGSMVQLALIGLLATLRFRLASTRDPAARR